MTFRVGQKVIVIDEHETIWEKLRRWIHPYPGDHIEVGRIYEVSKVMDGGFTVCLRGVYSPANRYWGEGWLASGFRPVVERKASIEIFTLMLNPQKESV